MCNAWNHAAGCQCGWGGGHGGRSGYYATTNHYRIDTRCVRWQHAEESFCCPTSCPVCGAAVFFVRHNGGSVWFDELGKPWPKHLCFDAPSKPSVYYYHSERYGWNSTDGIHTKLNQYSAGFNAPVFAIVVQCKGFEFHNEDLVRYTYRSFRMILWCATGRQRIISVLTTDNHRPEDFVGETAVVSRPDKKMILLSSGSEITITGEFNSEEQLLSDLDELEVGELYEHPVYGICKLLTVQRVGEEYGVSVLFQTGRPKRLLLTRADLKLVMNFRGTFRC